MLGARPADPGKRHAADAHATHVGREQNAERHRRRSDYELEELKPDDLVDQGSNATPDEEGEERGKHGVAVSFRA
jgi:hypothetical protein